MRAYADSSFIVSLYLPEPRRTERAVDYMNQRREALPFTPHHRLEVRNAIRLLVWSKRISAVDRSRVFREMEEDLDAETFLIHTALDYRETYRRAERIAENHNESIGCRSSDLFHVAAALDLGLEDFLTFDEKQRQMARTVGLNVDF
jgi:predicted nucleic acid-binding protein